MRLDLNADLGEGAGQDFALLPLISSANISCGAHAGTWPEIAAVTAEAVRLGVVVGAHPGHADPEHFGRRELTVDPVTMAQSLFTQVDRLVETGVACGSAVRYLKPHGGLYHQAGRDEAYASAVVAAAERHGLAVMGLPGTVLAKVCRNRVRFVAEGFADRGYRQDGTLIPRGEPGAYIESADDAVSQVRRLIREQSIETVCVHGDNPQAVEFVRSLRRALIADGFEIRAFA